MYFRQRNSVDRMIYRLFNNNGIVYKSKNKKQKTVHQREKSLKAAFCFFVYYKLWITSYVPS